MAIVNLGVPEMSQSERLQSARQVLKNTDVPFQIRVVSYLRLSCFALDDQGGRYSQLMKALFSYDPDWWTTCEVAASGGLYSSDPIVTALLRPLEECHRGQEIPLAS